MQIVIRFQLPSLKFSMNSTLRHSINTKAINDCVHCHSWNILEIHLVLPDLLFCFTTT